MQKQVWSSVRAVNDRQITVQQNGLETLHRHRAMLKQETGHCSVPWDLSNPPTKKTELLTDWRAENAQSLDRSRFENVATFNFSILLLLLLIIIIIINSFNAP